MNNEKGVKDKFIDWCSYIHPDVNPYIFIQRYNRYSDEYSLFLIDLMTELHHYISEKLPNIDFSFIVSIYLYCLLFSQLHNITTKNVKKNIFFI